MGGPVDDLTKAAEAVVAAHCGVKPGEQVVIVTDEERRPIGFALFDAARAAGAEAVVIEIIERGLNGEEPPPAAAAAMRDADVIIAPTTKSLSHTSARREATARGARVASMPKVTSEMMARCLTADPNKLEAFGRAYAQALTDAKTARLTSEGGSDCIFDLTARVGISDDGNLTSPSAFGNLPAGEAFIAPVEGKTNGVLVFDGSIGDDEITPSPVVVRIVNGRIVEMSGGPAPKFAQLPDLVGPLAWEVAELGIGTNDKATITGNILEDEKVASTVHVAFGNNATIGGKTQVGSHQDGVIRKATLELDGRLVLDAGVLLLG